MQQRQALSMANDEMLAHRRRVRRPPMLQRICAVRNTLVSVQSTCSFAICAVVGSQLIEVL